MSRGEKEWRQILAVQRAVLVRGFPHGRHGMSPLLSPRRDVLRQEGLKCPWDPGICLSEKYDVPYLSEKFPGNVGQHG